MKKPQMLFWISVVLRLILIWSGAAVAWYFLGIWVAFALALVCTSILMFMQYYYLAALDAWLDDPKNKHMPNGWGVWHNVYMHLFHMNHEQEKNRKEQAELLTRFRQAMHFLPDGVVILDNVLYLTWCNPMAEKHLKISLEEDREMCITNLVQDQTFTDYIILGRYREPLELKLHDRYLLMQVIPFGRSQQILVTHDRTTAVQIDRMRRDFVSNVSHELRTPLTVINGFLELSMMQTETDEQTRQSHLKLMYEQGQRMQTLVEDMLTLTNLESVDYPLKRDPFHVLPILEHIKHSALGLSGNKHTITLNNTGPDVIYGGADEIRTAFSNLVSNAVRYTPEGGSIHIVWESNAEGPRFSVTDTGIGIEAKHIPRLTQRFYRVDTSRQIKGTGIGLSIVRHIVLRHHARLDITSTLGKGSCFAIQFTQESLRPAAGEVKNNRR